MDKVKVIFVVPADNCEYIGIGLLASCLKKSGITDVSLASAHFKKIEAAAGDAPRCVFAFSPFSFCIDDFIKLARALKARYPHCVNVFGGPHATFAPEIIYADGVDAVCRGEAEEAFPEFVLALIKNAGVIPAGVKNWWVKDDSGAVHKNEVRQVSPDLDALPYSDKSFFTRTLFFKRGFRRFIFSRGCIYACAYCSVPSYGGLYEAAGSRYRRSRSVESAVAEVRHVLEKYGGSAIGIVDSIFGVDIDWLERFASLYKQKIGLPFYCHTEAAVASERYVSLLKKAGCYFTLMGLECANEGVRRSVLNKHFSNGQFEAAARRIQEKNIRLGIYNIIGIPGSVFKDDIETLAINQKARPYFSESHVFSLYPGTALYEQWKCRTQGKLAAKKGVYWAPVTSRLLCPDLKKVIRLHYLFNLLARYKAPLALAKVLSSLPLGWLFRFLANCAAGRHYKLYNP